METSLQFDGKQQIQKKKYVFQMWKTIINSFMVCLFPYDEGKSKR